ncbi:DUF2269 family protein [Desmospora activa]|uniref:Uncharacterized protein n=1 Tax=Desmospora activa DSM 45169 TaxID=1121389 RepID=A0A2T4ZCR5_9BACL|nr:DUF2269 family protein [Desmospora activa]PTM59670.1 hypothetical protein C8J48_2300 [Desmospora activa DSM 45169]
MGKLTVKQRKWLLSLHLLFAAILFGVTVAFLILTLTAANTRDPEVLQACYTSMHILAKTSVRASTIGTVVTGILLSVLTRWGLFRFYWIIAKEVLTLFSIGLGVVGMVVWTLQGITMTTATDFHASNPAFIVNQQQLLVGIILQIIFLIAMFLLSVFKPCGKRKRSIKTTTA